MRNREPKRDLRDGMWQRGPVTEADEQDFVQEPHTLNSDNRPQSEDRMTGE
jgi:hypothetical protein